MWAKQVSALITKNNSLCTCLMRYSQNDNYKLTTQNISLQISISMCQLHTSVDYNILHIRTASLCHHRGRYFEAFKRKRGERIRKCLINKLDYPRPSSMQRRYPNISSIITLYCNHPLWSFQTATQAFIFMCTKTWGRTNTEIRLNQAPTSHRPGKCCGVYSAQRTTWNFPLLLTIPMRLWRDFPSVSNGCRAQPTIFISTSETLLSEAMEGREMLDLPWRFSPWGGVRRESVECVVFLRAFAFPWVFHLTELCVLLETWFGDAR